MNERHSIGGCERCGDSQAEWIDGVALCASCLGQIVREWQMKMREFGELTGKETANR